MEADQSDQQQKDEEKNEGGAEASLDKRQTGEGAGTGLQRGKCTRIGRQTQCLARYRRSPSRSKESAGRPGLRRSNLKTARQADSGSPKKESDKKMNTL